MKTKAESNGVAAKRTVVKGKRVVVLDEAEFDRLLRKADEWEPIMPAPLPNGNYPAREAVAAMQAIDILRARRKLGLSQAELARRSGVSIRSLNRIEEGVVRSPMIRTIEKIDQVLTKAEAELKGHSKKGVKPRKKKAMAPA